MGNTESTQPSAKELQSQSESQPSTADDEPWWHEIEHDNLVLEQTSSLAIKEDSSATTAMDNRNIRPVEVSSSTSAKENKNIRPVGDSSSSLTVENKNLQSVEDSRVSSSPPLASGQSLAEFREELRHRREARQTAVQDLRDELNQLREKLSLAEKENQRLRQEQGKAEAAEPSPSTEANDPDDDNPSSRSRHANIELANAQLALQQANADNLTLRGEVDVVQRQVGTLKEVISCCKEMLNVKEEQCAQLKMKLTQIENSFSEREMKIMSNNLRQEYERQLVNIRQLRQLYEERQRVAAAEYENLQRLISIKKDELVAEQEKSKNFEERNQNLLKEVETANEELAKLREECAEHKYEKRTLKDQVGAVNLLFSQLVMGFNGKNNLDIDRLTQMLEENRQLLNQMTQAEGSCSDGATLPKLLFELVEQAAQSGEADLPQQQEQEEEQAKSRSATPTPTQSTAETEVGDITDSVKPEALGTIRKQGRRSSASVASLKGHEPEIMGKVATAQEIIGNLPKVWKVLMELLSHHKIERVQLEELPSPNVAGGTAKTEAGAATTAAAGKANELSVSKTYIKLKDLILEKKSLVKETNRLKTLNSHLDYRLNEQEKRLSAVSLELTKTWHLVGKMQRQHRQLHTQEQILRYQLQQKRRLLSELKDELEYCRRKWAVARAKNDESQEQCDAWRREFARRKLEDANHSAESGYSDSGPQSDEEREGVAGGNVAEGTAGESSSTSTAATNSRRKHLRDQFEHTRRIKRMQSSSPGRQAAAVAAGDEDAEPEDIVLRWNSAPPTCGWRERVDEANDYDDDDNDDNDDGDDDEAGNEASATPSRGAIPKMLHASRTRQRCGQVNADAASASSSGTASRIQKLEEQCKSLIQQVLETSDNRERLEIQLYDFQDEISPAQHAVPLDEFINRKRLERMTRASSAPASGSLTPREEEYTRKRSERLGRLEEESRQLISRIKRTTDRGHYLKKSLDRLRRAPSREGSFESNTEEEVPQSAKFPLTTEEEAYTSRRAARLQRLEQESQQLLSQLSKNTKRGDIISNKLDTLHERHGHDEPERPNTSANISQTMEQRLEDIERVSANRAERLRLMEAQGNELIARLSHTSERGTAMINRIAEREASRRQEAELVEQAQATELATSSSLANNIASSRIVGTEEEAEGAACCVTVTTTSSQLAIQQQSTGAIPKKSPSSKPMAQLCAATRQDDAAKKRTTTQELESTEKTSETLEDMVQRLRDLPYPEGEEEKPKDFNDKENE